MTLKKEEQQKRLKNHKQDIMDANAICLISN